MKFYFCEIYYTSSIYSYKKAQQVVLTRKLGNSIWRYFYGYGRNIEKSRAENKNKDIYEKEILKQANTSAIVVMMALAAIFFVVQIFVDDGINWGIWALVFSANMTIFWVKYIKFRHKNELLRVIAYTLLVAIFSAAHVYNLISLSTTL